MRSRASCPGFRPTRGICEWRLLDKHPRKVRVQDGDDDQAVAAVIDVDEFQEARNDPEWLAFQQEAREYRISCAAGGRQQLIVCLLRQCDDAARLSMAAAQVTAVRKRVAVVRSIVRPGCVSRSRDEPCTLTPDSRCVLRRWRRGLDPADARCRRGPWRSQRTAARRRRLLRSHSTKRDVRQRSGSARQHLTTMVRRSPGYCSPTIASKGSMRSPLRACGSRARSQRLVEGRNSRPSHAASDPARVTDRMDRNTLTPRSAAGSCCWTLSSRRSKQPRYRAIAPYWIPSTTRPQRCGSSRSRFRSADPRPMAMPRKNGRSGCGPATA